MASIRTGDLTVLISAGDIRRFALARQILQRPARSTPKIRTRVHIPIKRHPAAIPDNGTPGTPKGIAKANPMTRALQDIRQTREIEGFTDPADPGLQVIQQALAGPKENFLLIEEPELHLDPARQEIVARTLVQAVNHGVKVFLTTQSEWIAREINDCITIGTLLQETGYLLAENKKIIKKYGYREDHGIGWKQVKAYELKDGLLKSCKMGRLGIKSHVMDNFIDQSNRKHNTLWNHV